MRTTKSSSLVSVVKARQRVIFQVSDSRLSRSLVSVCSLYGRRRRLVEAHHSGIGTGRATLWAQAQAEAAKDGREARFGRQGAVIVKQAVLSVGVSHISLQHLPSFTSLSACSSCPRARLTPSSNSSSIRFLLTHHVFLVLQEKPRS